jgi:hypothetical protein
MRTHAVVARRCRRAVPALVPLAWLALALCGGPGCGSSSSPRVEPDAGDGDAGGTGSDAGPQPIRLSCEEANGARLRKVVRQHGDGSSEFIRLHDTDFAETCSYAVAADGVLRCLPAVDGAPFADGAIRYTDDLCTAAIGQLTAPVVGDLPGYMRELVPPVDPCAGLVPHFYQLADRLVIAPDTIIFQKVGDVCTGVAAPVTDFFAVAAELPANTFVEGTESFTDSGRIQQPQVDGADGSRVCNTVGPLRDRDLSDHPCSLEQSEDASLRCLPEDVGPTSVFSDDLCAAPIEVALVDETCNADAAYATDPAGAACQLRRRVRELGGPLAAPVFELVADVCTAAAADPVAHGIGASVSPFSFAELTPRTDAPAAGGRLDRVDLVTDDGLRMFGSRWLDTELDQACTFRRAADGTDRCLPQESPLELVARSISVFTDAACTATAVVGDRDPSCAAGDPKFVLEAIAGGRTRVDEAGGALPGPFFELDAAAVCIEITGRVFYGLGDEILAQTFVGGTEMVE